MAKTNYAIIYEDESIIVVNKSTGITVIPTRDGHVKSLKEVLDFQLGIEAFVVHRIDRETSGIVIFAKNEEAHRHLNNQFLKRKVIKEYICLSNGTTQEEWIEINKPILKDTRSKLVRIHPTGKKAISHFKSIENSKKFSKNIIRIETGRMHQIRIHLASVGHPILGDELYNKNPKILLSQFKKKYQSGSVFEEERSMMQRTALHAFSLTVFHPESEEKMYFEAELPKDIKACWTQIMKWDK